MHWFYIFALLPILIGYLIKRKDKRICTAEWVIASIIALLIAALFHYIAYKGMTKDVETWSGQIQYAKQFSSWEEAYEEAIYRTITVMKPSIDMDGNVSMDWDTEEVFDHWEPRTRWHGATWRAYSNLDTDYDISEGNYIEFCEAFGSNSQIQGTRTTSEHNSKMIGGDPYDYVTSNNTGHIQPVTKLVKFENRVKAAPSVFSFMKVEANIPVFEYPANKNPWSSDRLLGDAKNKISILDWDRLNARLGFSKHVNLIMVGFTNEDSKLGDYQEAKWTGGKKNDLVLCYGPGWAKVFSWCDKEAVKRNLEILLKEYPINDKLISSIEKEIRENYVAKNWSDFDYIAIEPRKVHFIWFFAITIFTQIVLYIIFHNNEFDVEDYRY